MHESPKRLDFYQDVSPKYVGYGDGLLALARTQVSNVELFDVAPCP